MGKAASVKIGDDFARLRKGVLRMIDLDLGLECRRRRGYRV